MENLNVKGMMKNRLSEFIRQMKDKCEKIGARFIQVDKWHSNKQRQLRPKRAR